MAGIKPHYLIGNLPHPKILKSHGDFFMADCFAHAMSQKWLA